jgi:peptidylprolyl isomerase
LRNGRAATFNLNGVVRGWTIGLPGMKVGGIRRLYLPAALAYGERGSLPKIGPNEDLIFEVKVLKVVPPPPSGSSSDRTPDGMSAARPDLNAPEWKEFKDGIKIWDVRPGEGPECPTGANVNIHYTGWLLNGSQFDSSTTGGGPPANFSLGNLIQGWQIAVPGMKPGGIRRMIIPYKLAYGENGSPPKIPARSDLVFEIKLIAFQ